MVKSAEIPYTDIRIHKIGKVSNYIGIKRDATGVYIVHFDHNTGKQIDEIHPFAAGTEVYYTLLNNQLVISDKNAIKLYVYQFTGSEYKFYSDGLSLNITSSVRKEYNTGKVYEEIKDLKAGSKEEFYSSLQSSINKFKIEHKDYCEGLFMYAFTVTLKDGSETGMYNLSFVATDDRADNYGYTQNNGFIDVEYGIPLAKLHIFP